MLLKIILIIFIVCILNLGPPAWVSPPLLLAIAADTEELIQGNFTSKVFEDFCCRLGIVHRISTAYNPRAYKRAELAVTVEQDLSGD